MKDTINDYLNNIKSIDSTEYSTDMEKYFCKVPKVAEPLIYGAKITFSKIEKMLLTTPSFINLIKSTIPEETIQAILTDEQKSKLASGALKLMTKKDGTLMANLVNPETNKIVSTISLEKVYLSPELSKEMTSYVTQLQMAEIAEQIQMVHIAIEEVRQGQEYDRLATAYSCQQKLLQAMVIKNPELQAMALLRIAYDAEDSRNLLMQSQSMNIEFIKNQPESFWKKLVSGANSDKINARMNEIRGSLSALNMVSLVEAMAYYEVGEMNSAQLSLQYYADYIQHTYLESPGLVNRLDMIDKSPKNYWSKTLPDIKKKIQQLPYNTTMLLIGGDEDGTKDM